MIHRYRGGIVPEAKLSARLPLDDDLEAKVQQAIADFRKHMDNLQIHLALQELWRGFQRANQYVEENAPWKLAKDPAQASQLDSVLYNLAESVRLISVLATPFLPTTARQMREQLGVADKLDRLAEEIGWGRLAAGATIGQVAPLFPKRT